MRCLAFRLLGAENERGGWKKGRGLDWAFQWERSWIVVLTRNYSKFPQCKNTVKVCGRSFLGVSFFFFESTTHTVSAKFALDLNLFTLFHWFIAHYTGPWITALASHVSQDRFKNPITKWYLRFTCILQSTPSGHLGQVYSVLPGWKLRKLKQLLVFFYLWKKLPEYITVSLKHDCLLCNYLSWFCFYRLLNAILIFS